jgi:flagellar basal-body rod modification protein FlgD
MQIGKSATQPLPQSTLDVINRATQNGNTPGKSVDGKGPTASQTAQLNQNEFLTLMLAQLKAQDPTKPVDSTAFLGQLAQIRAIKRRKVD